MQEPGEHSAGPSGAGHTGGYTNAASEMRGGRSALPGRSEAFPAARLAVPGGWMFMYPTALGGAWSPGVRAMWHEAKWLKYAPVEVWSDGWGVTHRGWFSGNDGRVKRKAKSLRRRWFAGGWDGRALTVDGPVMDARDEADGNVAHFVYSVLTRLLTLRQAGVEATAVLRRRASPVAREALRLLEFSVVCTDRPVMGERWDATGGGGGAYEPWMGRLFGALDEGAGLAGGWPSHTPRRVFVARRGARALENHGQVEAWLRERGYVTRYFEDLSVREQWATMRFAESVVAVHGAALANLAFATGGPAVVELFHPGYVVDCYRHLTAAVGGRWTAVTGRLSAADLRELDERRRPRSCAGRAVTIDVGSLERALAAVDGG